MTPQLLTNNAAMPHFKLSHMGKLRVCRLKEKYTCNFHNASIIQCNGKVIRLEVDWCYMMTRVKETYTNGETLNVPSMGNKGKGSTDNKIP